MVEKLKLKRTLDWKTYGLYGLGNILGAGIYVLIGVVASEAGNGAIWSFLIAGVVAAFTAVTYSALASKFPVSAGEAVYARRAFGSKYLTLIVGLTLAFSGVVSAGVLLNGFANYASVLFELPRAVYIAGCLLLFLLVAIKGIAEAARLAVFITIIETIGLFLIIAVSLRTPDFLTNATKVLSTSFDGGVYSILFGTFLAFYAFIGFEDMVNVAEEVKQPEVNLKKGMLSALGISSVLYVIIAIVALAVIPANTLGESGAPLADVFKAATGSNLPIITIIGVFAIVNGVLAQIIMSSRVLYGLSAEKLAPVWLGRVGSKTRTPINASIFVAAFMLIAVLAFPLSTLASVTSFALLLIFSVVQLSAIRLINEIKLNKAVPVIGLGLNIALIMVQIIQWL